VQPPPQSTSLSSPFVRPSRHSVVWQVPFKQKAPAAQSFVEWQAVALAEE